MPFPRPHVIPPVAAEHTHAAIILHGRGSNGPDFASELFSSRTSDGKTLAESFPTWRWVFPSACERWSAVFEEEFEAWFDVYSLTNIEERAELQVDGLRESLRHMLEVIEEEAGMLGGKREKVVLGGMSQGMAMGLWSLLGYKNDHHHQDIKFAAFVGFCGWLPFARDIAAAQDEDMSATARSALEMVAKTPLTSTPVFLCHGTDDAFVDVALGRQAAQTLERIGMNVRWMEYTGAENDGHWIKEPEGFNAIVSFLKQR